MTADSGSFLAVGAVLFVLGAIGFVTRRNLILIVLSAELMLHGVSLTFLTFSRLHHSIEGQSFTVFILTVAACEAGLLLSLVLALFQQRKSLDVELWSELREADLPARGPTIDAGEPPIEMPAERASPLLIPAGGRPFIEDDVPLAQISETMRRNRDAVPAGTETRA